MVIIFRPLAKSLYGIHVLNNIDCGSSAKEGDRAAAKHQQAPETATWPRNFGAAAAGLQQVCTSVCSIHICIHTYIYMYIYKY